MKKTILVIVGMIAFTAAYAILAGGIDSHFWLPFVLLAVASSGLGRMKVGKGNLNRHVYPEYMKRAKRGVE